MAEQTNAHRLRIKIGDAEFEASGTPESVKEQYDLFLQALKAASPTPPAESTHSNHASRPHEKPRSTLGVTPSEVPVDVIQRAFTIRDDLVTLNALPRTANAGADTLLALLWGFEHMQNQTSVSAMALTDAARASGLQLNRVDRVISPQQAYFQRAGARKGTRYSLNNPGRAYAATVLRGLYE